MPLQSFFTADDVRSLPDDGKRYETVHGELLVTPSPGGFHQRTLRRLIDVIGPYLASRGCEDLLLSPADVSFGPDTLVQPDVFVADCSVFNRSGRWADLRTFYLMIEVLSPLTARHDRTTKRRLYQQQHIPDYWVVDIELHQAEAWTPDALAPVIARDELRWRHPAISEVCVVDLGELFRGLP